MVGSTDEFTTKIKRVEQIVERLNEEVEMIKRLELKVEKMIKAEKKIGDVVKDMQYGLKVEVDMLLGKIEQTKQQFSRKLMDIDYLKVDKK